MKVQKFKVSSEAERRAITVRINHERKQSKLRPYFLRKITIDGFQYFYFQVNTRDIRILDEYFKLPNKKKYVYYGNVKEV